MLLVGLVVNLQLEQQLYKVSDKLCSVNSEVEQKLRGRLYILAYSKYLDLYS